MSSSLSLSRIMLHFRKNDRISDCVVSLNIFYCQILYSNGVGSQDYFFGLISCSRV